jgi:hypothetical protein
MILQIKGTQNTPTSYRSDKTKAYLLGSRLEQWSVLEKGVVVVYYRRRQSDTQWMVITSEN